MCAHLPRSGGSKLIEKGSGSDVQSARTHALKWQIIALLMAAVLALAFPASANLTAFYLHRQDIFLLGAGLVLLLLCAWRLPPRASSLPGHILFLPGGVLLLLLVCLIGRYLVLGGYDLSRDEQMAIFDAEVFRSGHLVTALPALWRDSADALNTSFMVPAEARGAWISNYLPGNAALHALAGRLTGPLLSALGLIALWGCVRRIWPEDRELPIVALLLYIGSGQIVLTGMTSYAMSGHLALNLIWLWLLLRGSWRMDVAALAVGFLATGLHQPLMHPMFAAPILFLCLYERQWQRAALYLAGYAIIGAFWLWWPGWTWGLVQTDGGIAQPAGVDYASRLVQTVMAGGDDRVPNMLANLLRFVSWQHLLLPPLFALGIAGLRTKRLMMALAAGVGLTVVVMFIILAYQGHGFGYRYLHGLIGSCILIALHGWKQVGGASALWRPLLLRTSLAGLVIMLGLQAWMAHRFYTPYARASARIDASDADYAIVRSDAAPFAQDLVINRPDLSNRPIRLDSVAVTPKLVGRLCRNSARVTFVGNAALADIRAYFGVVASAGGMTALSRRFEAAGCHFEWLN